MSQASTIAVFDSGFGGLTVLKELLKAFPQHNFVYLGDTARVPYGTKSPAAITQYSLEAAQYLKQFSPEALIVACNSASSVALDALKQQSPELPVMGVVEPGAKAAVAASQHKQILVLGTQATISSQSYTKAIHAIDSEVHVDSQACPLFVPLVEEGLFDGDIVNLAIERYVQPKLTSGVDTILLGCTHYPLLKSAIQDYVGPGIQVVDSAEPLTVDLADHLNQVDNPARTVAFFVTDAPEKFSAIASQILGTQIEPAQLVYLEHS